MTEQAEAVRREPLTRARIVDAAIGVLDADGLQGLTMRKLGAVLSVEAMSLYQHFRNKDDLLAAVRENLFAQIAEMPEGVGDWKERLTTVMLSAYDLCIQHPSFLVALFDIPSTPSSSLRSTRDVETLRSAGFSEADARTALSALVAQMVGALHQSRRGAVVDHRARFEFGLLAVLMGFEARLAH